MKHTPQIVTSRTPDGLYTVMCRKCGAAIDKPTAHEPIVRQWRAQHIRGAM